MTVAARTRERASAAAILAGAAVLAAWIVLRQPPPLHKTPETTAAPADHPVMLMPVEIVTLPPSPAAPSAPPPSLPSAPRASAVPAPPTPAPPPAPAPAQRAPTPPPEPPVVLKPEPVEPPSKATVAPVIPLRPAEPSAPPVTPVTPLRPSPPVEPAPASQPERLLVPEAPAPSPPATAKPLAPKPVEPMPRAAKPVEPARAAASPPPPPPSPQHSVEARTEAPPQPQPPTPISQESAQEGRVLLRLLEHGAGPTIEIGWPADAAARERLYRVFVRCMGMRVGYLAGDGRLFLDGSGRAAELDTDRYSGFVRRREGAGVADEDRDLSGVRGAGSDAVPVRLFPRRIDAYLIGGLRQAVGEGYMGHKTIRAVYRLAGDRVVVDGIAADGTHVAGTIDLSEAAPSCGR